MKAGGAVIERAHVQVPAGEVELSGALNMPVSPVGVVLFEQGSGNTRPGAAHLFEEPGAPGEVRLAADWFTAHLR